MLVRPKKVGERLAIHALLLSIEDTNGAVISGEVIYDGLLFRLSGGGMPSSWDVSTLCAAASARAEQLYGMEVVFKAKPLVEGDIFPEGRDDGTTKAVLDKGGVLYAAIEVEHAERAFGRAILHAAKRKHRFVLALQTGIGLRFTSRADYPSWDGMRMRLRPGHASVWEMVRPGTPMRPWVCFSGCEGDIPEFEAALRAAVHRFFGSDVTASFAATAEGGGKLALVVTLRTPKGEAALPDFATVQKLIEVAFDGLAIAQRVLAADRLLMLGQTHFGRPGDARRLLTRGATGEDACFTAPTGVELLSCDALGKCADAPPQTWGEEYLQTVQESFPPDMLDEAHVCALVLRHCPPGDIHRNLHDEQVAKAVAAALWTTCPSEDDSQKVATQFIDWVTEGGASLSNTTDEAAELWEEVVPRSGVDSGKFDLQLVREMLDLLRDRTPELHAAFIRTVASSLTDGPTPGAQLPAFVTLEHKTVVPGRDAIGGRATLLGRYKYLATRAAPGTGKTESDMATMRESVPESALSVTTRRSVAQAMKVRYNGADLQITFWHYQDEAFKLDPWARRDVDHLICELESICSLDRDYRNLLLDEFMSILMQLASDINRSRFKSLNAALKKLCRSAKNVFLTDALLTASAVSEFVDIVEGPGHTAKVLFSVFQPETPAGRSVVLHSKQGSFKADDLEAAFKERLETGEARLFVFTNIKKLVPDVVKAFNSQWRSCEHNGKQICNNYLCIFFN